MTITPEQLIEDFAIFDDWDDRFRYIIELGDELPPLPDEHRLDQNLVQGCQSRVWLVSDVEGSPPTLQFSADSDSAIVKGLISILVMLFSGRSPDDILELDVESLFTKLELGRALLGSRSNGLASMVKRIRALAQEVKESQT